MIKRSNRYKHISDLCISIVVSNKSLASPLKEQRHLVTMGARTRLPAGFYKDIFDSVLPRERRIPCAVLPQVLGEYTVERIVAKRFRERKVFFLVRWKGYDPEEDTWEPKQHLPDDILCKFENPEQHCSRCG